MALQTMGRGKSLSFTQVGQGGPTGPLERLQGFTFSRSKELAPFLDGTSQVDSHYSGKKTATIAVQVADLAALAKFEVGQKYTSVELTGKAAADSDDVAVGSEVKMTLSQAVVTEVGELTKGNEDSAPVVGSVTFTLSRHADATTDPTWTIGEVAE